MGEQPELNDTERLVQRVLRGLQQRALLGSGDAARAPLEANLVHQLAQLEATLDGASAPPGASPPRRVAVALALALHSQPHLSATLASTVRDGTAEVEERGAYPPEAPFVVANEVLERSLGLSQWELDDLREDVDRRAGTVLKQERALCWLWDHFGLPASRPSALFRVLFPGQDRRANEADLVRRGSRLYALLGVPAVPLPALYVGWLEPEDEAALPPLASFRARYVDHGLRRSLARGIGAAPYEVDQVLDQMVVLVPRDHAVDFLERDQWRVTGLSTLTGLANDSAGAERVVEPADRQELEWERWLRVEDGKVKVTRPATALFDEFALARAQRMMRQVYAALLARAEQTDEGKEGFRAEDLDLLDVGRHLRMCLEPLVAWARNETTYSHVAARLRVEPSQAEQALGPLADAWQRHMEGRWLAPPSPKRRHTIAGILLAHLVVLQGSAVRAALREPDRRWEHRSLSLLFAGHYLAEAPIERLWLKGLSDMLFDEQSTVPPPEDIVGCWFWPTWQRILDNTELQTAPTEIPP